MCYECGCSITPQEELQQAHNEIADLRASCAAHLERIRELEAENQSLIEGRHPCPTCDCPMYHRAKSPTGWYCPECELSALRSRITAEGVAKVLYEHNPVPTDMVGEYWSWEGLPEDERIFYIEDARALVAHLRGEE